MDKTERWGEIERGLPFAGLLLQEAGIAEAGLGWTSIGSLTWVTGTQTLGPTSATSPGTLSGSWIGSGTGRKQTSNSVGDARVAMLQH